MIVVTRLNGARFALNPDLVERIESTPDTILVLIDGTKFVVSEPLAEVVRLISDYRADVLARSYDATVDSGHDDVTLFRASAKQTGGTVPHLTVLRAVADPVRDAATAPVLPATNPRSN
jgi:flagellar protein FlbD